MSFRGVGVYCAKEISFLTVVDVVRILIFIKSVLLFKVDYFTGSSLLLLPDEIIF